MDKNQELIGKILLEDDLFSTCSRRDIVRLLPFIEKKSYQPNEEIYKIGDSADFIFFIVSGKVELKSDRRSVKILESGSFGEESIKKETKYLLNAVALETTEIIKLPIENFEEILKNNKHFKDSAYSSLINHFSYEKMPTVLKKIKEKGKDETSMKIIGWICTLIIPPIVYNVLGGMDFKWEQTIFLTVASATLLMWIFRLANEFIPSLLAIIVIIILQVAPARVALSGFTNDSFFMAMSIFGISSVLVTSGLTFRIVINMLKFFPMSQYWHARTLLFTGIIMTPLLPSANGRIVMAVPILKDMIESLGYEKKGSAANLLAVTAFMGFTFFSSAFLSSKAIHFVIFGLFPTQIQEQFTWSYWFYASIPSFLVMLGLLMLVLKFLYRKKENPKLSKEIIDVQKQILGPMTSREWAALGGILLFGVGIATSSLHKIEMSWVGLIVLYAVLVLGILSKNDFQKEIDWTFLIYQAALIGLVKTISFTGLDTMLGNHLLWIGIYIKANIFIFVLMLTAVILALRLFIPNNATVIILASILFPIAELSGLNTWVVAYIILMMSDAWFLPYQCTYYVQFDDMMKSKNLVNLKDVIGINAFSILFRVAAIFASIPYWRMIGLL
jgi:DASS family divalent anion:Na+ symporter